MEQICLNGLPEVIGGAVTGVVTLASIAANVVSADSALGKVVHFLAINITAAKK